MPAVQITDTILRDAHQCLIATRLRTEDMLPACPQLDDIGFWSLEVWGGATFDTCLRFLKEDPWQRLRQLRAALPKTRLQMLLRGQNLLGYRHYSDDVVNAFVERAASNGIDVFRIFDALNDSRNLQVAIRAVKANGKHAQGTLCYTTSPVHTIAKFVSLAQELEAMGCDSIAIKDMAGLLTPYITADLVRALKQSVKIPLHLHSHDTAGLSTLCQLKAIENGCLHIDTALSSFAGGASHAPTESMVVALNDTIHNTGLDLTKLQALSTYFRQVRKKYQAFESDVTGLDTRVHSNQVPGGMISNLYNQLREQNALDKLDAVLVEIPRVRQDLGYPPLVTPASQIVGTQALLNVLTSQRYQNITNEVKLYFQGRYGMAPGPINKQVQQLAIGQAEIIDCRPADLLPAEMAQLRREIGTLALNEEDVLSYAMFPEIGKQFLQQRAEGKLVAESLQPPPSPKAVETGLTAPVEFKITLHGETYHIKMTGTGHPHEAMRPFYMLVDGDPEEVLVETLQAFPQHNSPPNKTSKPNQRPRATEPGHVSTSMPATITAILVKVGDAIQQGDPLLVTEAMKMETEIQAPLSGILTAIYIEKGDSVTPDEALMLITPT